jgi:secondary thiamine-phosphate synthase enzyme
MGMRQSQSIIEIQTHGAGLYEFTPAAQKFMDSARISTGLLHVFCRHTSCSLLIQENADPDVKTDLNTFFRKLVPEGMDWVVHRTEGPDDMPAHIKAALTQTSLTVPIGRGVPLLGTWQGLYLFEHRTRPHLRQVVLHILGD